MKKNLLLAGLALFATGAMAQVATKVNPATAKPIEEGVKGASIVKQSVQKAYLDTFWYEDFAGGVPTGWQIVDNTGNGYNWLYRTTYFGNDSVRWSDDAGVLASQSAANGFMLLGGDYYNTDYATGNMVASPLSMDGYFQTAAINCANEPSVLLKFTTYFRYCCSSANSRLSVFVSNDGTNWEEFDVRDGVPVNSSSSTRDITVNISSAAANQATVYIRFHKYGASHYFWQVDDIALVEGPTDDLQLLDEFVYFDSPSYDFGPLMTMIPNDQIRDITFAGDVYNNGSNDQPNTTVGVDINDGSSSVYQNASGPVASFATLTRDTLDVTTAFTPAADKSYDVTFAVASTSGADLEPANNTKTSMFMTNLNTMAFDYDVASGSFSADQYVGGGIDGDAVGTSIELSATQKIHSLSVYVASTSSDGMKIEAQIFETDADGNIGAQIGTSALGQYTLTAADLDSWVTIPVVTFDGTNELAPGEYVIAFAGEGFDNGLFFDVGEDNTVNQVPGWYPLIFIGGSWGYAVNPQIMLRANFSPLACATSSLAATTTVISGETGAGNDGQATVTATGGAGGYSYVWSNGETTQSVSGLTEGTYTVTVSDAELCTTTATVLVIGKDEVYNVSNVKVYPNPAKNMVNVSLNNVSGNNYSVSVRNIIGQVVYTNNFSVNGSAIENIDISNLNKGVYLVTVKGEGAEHTERLIVE